MRESKVIAIGGVLLWLACSLAAIKDILDGRLTGVAAIAWCIAFVLFGVALIVDSFSTNALTRSVGERTAIFWMLLLMGFVMVYFSHAITKYASSVSLVLAAARLPYITSERKAWLAVGAIELALIVLLALQEYWLAVFGNGGAVAASLVFVMTFGIQERRERAARAELAIANDRLLANSALLTESARTAERLRISRDLHDTLGHHLTALSIQLDVAARRSEGAAAEHIREAHAITRLLLSDVRDVVGQLRTNQRMDIADRIRGLVDGIRDLQIHIDMTETLEIDEARADTVLRCVQEIVTNTRRHAAAGNLWIRLTVAAKEIRLEARDDGRGAVEPAWGNGLVGMRERFVQYGGRIEIDSTFQHGFSLTAILPLHAAAP